ncbi:glycosyl hydrolase family 18 protein [Marinoscillum pacificum]|uniref:glycosyl hydrolase family 18 protein n=1 Tax=Marinoscillum pacificum TaxID=392723 RepID=UPI00280A93C4|nr:glycosyl hydrolase family 18 protein [Marinoscillum pacificum]
MFKLYARMTGVWKVFLLGLTMSFGLQTIAQVDTGGPNTTADHNKQIVGYITNWDAWKAANAGLPAQGALTHLNIDYSKYTILNYSFFGVAQDGSLHSGDLRNKNIYQPGAVQQPGDIFFTDIYSSWDMHILFGEIDPIQYISQAAADRAIAQGFDVQVNGTSWSHPDWGLSGNLPVPLHKEDGAPGVLELAHQNGVKVMASIGGWSMCKHFPEMAADPAKRATFVADCQKLINTGFDGIDLDWEYPGPYSGMNFTGTQADFENFKILVQEIRAAIGPDKLITAAFSADPVKLAGFDWAALSNTIDYFNMMTYDFNGGFSDIAGHNAPVYSYDGAESPTFNWQSTYNALMSYGVPAAKINFGIPFYGRGVVTDGTAALNAPTLKRQETVQPDGPISTASDFTNWPRDVYDGTPNYYYIKQQALGSGSGWTRHWDNQAQVPYLTKGNFFLSYDDVKSIGIKADYIVNNNLGGTIVWTVYGDLEIGGSVTNFGTKLKRWSDVDSELINKVNEQFAAGGTGGNVNPVTSITSPTNGATYEVGDNITISASASDPDGSIASVEFYEGSTLLGTDTSAPYEYTITNAQEGSFALKTKATDNEGGTAFSTTVNVTVGDVPNQVPTVSVTSPANGATYSEGSAINISATASDSDGSVAAVEFFANGTSIGTVTSSPYSVNWTPAMTGSFSLTAIATDDQGATSTSTAITITVESQGGGNCSSVSQYVENGGYGPGSEVYNDGSVYTCKDYPYSGWCNGAAWAYEPGTGAHWQDAWTLSGECDDTEENVAPTTTITTPSNGASFAAGATIAITASASDSDGTVAKVAFYQNGTLLGEDTSAPYEFSWTTASAGTYSLTAVATDNDNASGTSAAVSVTVTSTNDNPAPTISITAPGAGSSFDEGSTISVTANANDDESVSKVEFFVNGSKVSEDDSAPYAYTWSPTVGSYSLTAVATDNEGATGNSAIVSVTINSVGGCSSDFKIVGYMPSWSGSANAIQYDKLTHIIYAFIRPTTTGGLTAVEQPAKLQSIVTQAHAQGVKVLIAVGGWSDLNNADFEAMSNNATGRQNFASNLLSLCNQYNLDGVDIDWEYPREGNTPQDYLAMMQVLNTTMHANGKLLTAAVAAQGYYADGILDGVFPIVDFLNLMAYDGGSGATHSPYSYATSTLNYWLGRGLPQSKAVLGVPFYARPSWKSFATLVSEGADPYADTYNGDYYNGITTIQQKTALAESQASGIMIWEISQDITNNNSLSLLNAIYQAAPDNCGGGGNPSVYIISPSNGSSVATGTALTLTANASDDGSITSVVFDVNGQTINASGSDGTYTASWTPTSDGSYTITVTATDNEGNTDSEQVTITAGSSVCNASTWSASAVYLKDDEVEQNGTLYRAKWWTQNESPDTHSASWDVWANLGTCGAGARLGTSARETPQLNITSYPNPFSDSFTLDFKLENSNVVNLTIYNAAGKEVFHQEIGTIGKGTHHHSINATGFPEGVYFCKIQIGSDTQTIKMVKQ